jgi:NADH-quinone oxidoreductase subunit M
MTFILSSLLLIPFAGAIIVFLVGLKWEKLSKYLTQIFAFATFTLSWTLFRFFNFGDGGIQLTEGFNWIPDFGINFTLGLDGLSLPLILMATTLIFLVSLQSPYVIHHREHLYYALILLFQVGILGVFIATNLVIFYVFWELVLIPMFFLIGQWGGERRKYAAVKFFIFTHVGSVLMLVSFIVIFVNMNTFDIITLLSSSIPQNIQLIAAIGIFIGAAVKLPAVPIHSWLPDAHVEAPSPVSVLLAGLLLKMAGYAFLKLGLGLVSGGMAALRPVLLILGVVGAFYASFAAIKQKDLKRLIAFTSINHMSLIMIAVAVASELAIMGAIFMMVSHGIIIGLMFFLSGIIQHHLGTREIGKLGKLRDKPVLSGVLIVGSVAAFGAPPMAGFIGEMMILFAAIPVYPWIMIIALSIAVTVVVYLWMLTRTIFTTKAEEFTAKAVESDPKSLKIELLIVGSLMLPIFILGFFPKLIISIISSAASQLASIAG